MSFIVSAQPHATGEHQTVVVVDTQATTSPLTAAEGLTSTSEVNDR